MCADMSAVSVESLDVSVIHFPPTCLLPTPCTIQLSDSRSLPTGDAFADGDFQLLDLPLAFILILGDE